jgi:hypothetical protein
MAVANEAAVLLAARLRPNLVLRLMLRVQGERRGFQQQPMSSYVWGRTLAAANDGRVDNLAAHRSATTECATMVKRNILAAANPNVGFSASDDDNAQLISKALSPPGVLFSLFPFQRSSNLFHTRAYTF